MQPRPRWADGDSGEPDGDGDRMSQRCANCGEIQYRLLWRDGKGIGTDCGCLRLVNGRNSVQDPYAGLVLEHVKGEDGKPLRFENLRQLSRWERDSGQIHAVTSFGENYIPSDWQAPTLKDLMRPREQRQEHGRIVSCTDGHRVISGNGFTARFRKD
jgi:hypothetical protein